jgi:hypothetical protein
MRPSVDGNFVDFLVLDLARGASSADEIPAPFCDCLLQSGQGQSFGTQTPTGVFPVSVGSLLKRNLERYP